MNRNYRRKLQREITTELRVLIRDYLNGKYSDDEIIEVFNLNVCYDCNKIHLEEDINYRPESNS